MKKANQKQTSARYYKNNEERLKERYNRTKDKKNEWLWKHVIPQCSLCVENDLVCLQFHHKYPEHKTKEVASLVKLKNRDMTAAVFEIEKCIVVCANCHWKIHAGKITIDHIPTIKVDKEKMISDWVGGEWIKNSRVGNNQYSKKFGGDLDG